MRVPQMWGGNTVLRWVSSKQPVMLPPGVVDVASAITAVIVATPGPHRLMLVLSEEGQVTCPVRIAPACGGPLRGFHDHDPPVRVTADPMPGVPL